MMINNSTRYYIWFVDGLVFSFCFFSFFLPKIVAFFPVTFKHVIPLPSTAEQKNVGYVSIYF